MDNTNETLFNYFREILDMEPGCQIIDGDGNISMPSTKINNCDKKIIFKLLGLSRLEERDFLCTKVTNDLSWGCTLSTDYVRTIGEKNFVNSLMIRNYFLKP